MRSGLSFCFSCLFSVLGFFVRGNDVLSTSEFYESSLTNLTSLSVRGTIRDAFSDDIDSGFQFLILDGESDTVYVSCESTCCSLSDLRALIGNKVVVHGRLNIVNCSGRQYLARILTIRDIDDIETIEARSADPFDVPELTLQPSANPKDNFPNSPRKVQGNVIAHWGRQSVLMTTAQNIPIEAEFADNTIPAVGDAIEAVGIPETDLIHLKLARAIWKPTTRSSPIPESPESVKLKTLFVARNGRYITSAIRYGKLIKVRGTVKGIILDRDGQRSLLLDEDGYTLPISCSAVPDLVDKIPEGAQIEATGICIIQFENWQPSFAFPHLRGIFLVLRSADDLTILSTPPWLTPLRCAIILCFLIAVIIAILIWNISLRTMVTRKSRELLREQVGKLKETMKLAERTRLAAELHDYLAQNLTVISYQVSAAESALASGSKEASTLLKTADRMLQSSRIDLRRCLWDLKSNALNEPCLNDAIRQTVTPVLGSSELSVRFNIRRARIDDSTTHAILSICRELSANAVRHGKATVIRIAGESPDGHIRFSVRDNGCGFDPAARLGQSEGHFGLDGVKERVKRLGGTLSIESSPDHGSRFIIILPIRQSPS